MNAVFNNSWFLGEKGYDPASGDFSDFEAWLQCYYVDGMKTLRDHNGRTIWFRVSLKEMQHNKAR